ncbi:Alkaline phosphatase precursor [Pseudoalteromonas sp. THAF3]|uniref:alkaline phosphatase n=1 Tax=Pseudoalteromonas TaxID=53246 RepID=UPI00110A0A25|nr:MULTISPECIES: alkaline phosphatase [Pseudoalteromonas]MCF2863890.1 alkaline phosphatase [Pseudoalteromonas sp. CNAT2-18]MCG7545207.1 alkaline phosphatase [Pseudoalteromonas sp. MM17-2]MCG7559811.1 alkaline phosphatase [Pseudoalteromonas sp. CNAT2-18.1]MCG7568108.1 alkaline phosphatase [Pseudoalteromonas sp. CnMc7-15]MCG7571759.1 alkaline phosphatase [Pseudoalteromonas sp. CNC9-20]|tara:strand:+ start:467 stop:2065 length:1599 start_codon:yes stop_codon:yes gene_type:complete
MKVSKLALAMAAASAISSLVCTPVQAGVLPDVQTNSQWYQTDKNKLNEKQQLANQQKLTKAKNVILFVGDGMGVSTLTAARILQGQNNGKMGEEGYLSFEKFPYSAQVKTYNVDAQTPDSAGTMTAMASGVKTDVGVIGVDEDIERGNCATVAGNELITALELAEIRGLSTGIVSTARITHATPAATYAKSADRNWEDVSDMPAQAVAQGCEDIATQLVNFEQNLEARFAGTDVDGIEVVMGGGRRHFLPKDETYNTLDARSAIEGDRTDGRDLTQEWQQKYADGVYVWDRAGFDAIADDAQRVFGLFNESHMQYEADRGNDLAGEPSLSEMTAKAISVLDNNDTGFFLTVESGRIDHAHHAGNAYNALNDTIELANAVQYAIENTNPEETLILVTADHSHVFTIAGYPKRGNPILGQVVAVGQQQPTLAADGKPYTTLGYANGLGFRDLGMETNADASYSDAPQTGRQNLAGIDTTTPGFHQEATIPLSSETHAGEDISLHAMGPSAHLAQGVIEQSMVFHIIDSALELTK